MKKYRIILGLSIRNIIKNRNKYIVAWVAVLLTALFFSAVASLGYMILDSIRESQLRDRGDRSMATLRFIMPEEYNKLKNDEKLKSESYSIIVAVMEQNDLVMEMRYAEERFAKNMYSYPIIGCMPSKKEEIATSMQMLEAMGVKASLGEKIQLSIPIGDKIYLQTFTLSGFWDANNLGVQHQCWISKELCDEIVPIPTTPIYEQEDIIYSGYYMMDIDFNSYIDIDQKLYQLLERHGYKPEDIVCQINNIYSFQNSSEIFVGIIIILAFLMFTGYFLTYNIFYIRITLDTQYYALLSILGMGEKELEMVIRTEALFLSLTGAPVGIVLGRFIAYWLVPYASDFLSYEMTIAQHVAWWVYGVIFLFTAVTIYMSCRKPIATVKKISLVSGIEYQGSVKRNKKNDKRNNVKICTIAWRNIFREKGKFWTVIVAVSLSVILFNSVYSLVGGFSLNKYLINKIDSDYIVSDTSILNMGLERKLNAISQDVCKQIEAMEGVGECRYTFLNEGNINIDRELKRQLMQIDLSEDNVKDDFISCQIYGLEERDAQNIDLVEGVWDEEKFASGKYIIINTSLDEEFFYHVGEMVKVAYENGIQKEYEVLAVGEVPYVASARYWIDYGCQVILPVTEYKENVGNTGAMLLRMHRAEEIKAFQEEAFIDIVKKAGLVCVSRYDYVKEFTDFKNAYLLLGSMLASVIGIIGILNFANTIITSVNYRERELTILNVIGMTERQSRNMLLWEGLYYALFLNLFSNTIGVFFSYLLVRVMSNIFWFVEWNFNVRVIIFGNILFLIISCISTLATYYLLGKKSMMLRLQKFNI